MGRLLSTALSILILMCAWTVSPDVGTGVAHAEEVTNDLQARLEPLAKAAKKNKSGKDMDALRKALEGLAELHEDAAGDDELQESIAKVVGSVSKNRRNEQVSLESIYVLGQLRTKHCVKYIRPYLVQKKPDQVSDVLRAAIDVSGQIPDSSFVGPLLKLVRKSKNFDAAALAMQALGNYRKLESHREKILKALIDTVKKDKPGRPSRGRNVDNKIDPSLANSNMPRVSRATSRWITLSPALAAALNELTGQDVADAESWFDVYKGAKAKLSRLFIAEDDDEDETEGGSKK